MKELFLTSHLLSLMDTLVVHPQDEGWGWGWGTLQEGMIGNSEISLFVLVADSNP